MNPHSWIAKASNPVERVVVALADVDMQFVDERQDRAKRNFDGIVENGSVANDGNAGNRGQVAGHQ